MSIDFVRGQNTSECNYGAVVKNRENSPEMFLPFCMYNAEKKSVCGDRKMLR